jgi:hypothetical protein
MNESGANAPVEEGGRSGLTEDEYMLALALANLSALHRTLAMPSPTLLVDPLFLKIRKQIAPTWATVENAWQQWKWIQQRRRYVISPDEDITEGIPSSVGKLEEELEEMVSDVKYEMDSWNATKQEQEACNESRKFAELLCLRLNAVMVWWNLVYYKTKSTTYCSVLLFPRKETVSAPSGLWDVNTFDMPMEALCENRDSYARAWTAASLVNFSELCHISGAEVPETIDFGSLSGSESGEEERCRMRDPGRQIWI